jgi:S-adenosylmethionine synthetase
LIVIEGGYMKKLFTSESVTEGHPDKVCDQISDAILDAYLSVDPYSKVACEVVAKGNYVLVVGEITSNGNVDIESIIRKTIIDIGYDKDEYGFNGNNCVIDIKLTKQSSDIKDTIKEDGAGDQGIMFGYACDETKELMPLPISLAHKLAIRLAYVRKNNIINGLRPDGKTQVTVEYENDIPVRIDNIVISTQHDDIDIENLRKEIIENVILNVVPNNLLIDTKYHINELGPFILGGPLADAGLTGRKIIVDTYGGYSRHGGGAFSGKDPSKVDRSAAYAARNIAKSIIANKLAKKCEIQLSYFIGSNKPSSILIDTFNTSEYEDEYLINLINNNWDLSPNGIINKFDLRKPIYKQLASYGHMGRVELNVLFENVTEIKRS